MTYNFNLLNYAYRKQHR